MQQITKIEHASQGRHFFILHDGQKLEESPIHIQPH